MVGQLANRVRGGIEEAIAQKTAQLKAEKLARQLESESLDVTIPGRAPKLGKKHPLTQVLDDLTEIFLGMGFSVATGPEVEYDYYNFEALNLPPDHPARDTQDTFYITDKVLLRTQTSPVQVRVMEQQKPCLLYTSCCARWRMRAVVRAKSRSIHSSR